MRLPNVSWYAAHPGHIVSRLRQLLYDVRHPDHPWLAPAAIRFCEANIDRAMVGLEWGSGRSTFWFGGRVRKLVSVEHDETWHTRVSQACLVRELNHIDCRFVPLDHPEAEPTVPRYPKLPAYVAVAEELESGSVGFALIDGHYRQACVIAVLPKLMPGGLLIIDNSGRLPLREWGVPEAWPVVHDSNGPMGRTTIWRKPSLPLMAP